MKIPTITVHIIIEVQEGTNKMERRLAGWFVHFHQEMVQAIQVIVN